MRLCYIFLKINEFYISFFKYLEYGKKFELVVLLVVIVVWICGIKRMFNFSVILDVWVGDFGYIDYFGIVVVKCLYIKYYFLCL